MDKHRAAAMIFAAGKGTRMQSHEARLPKPLVPVSGKALIDYQLELLQRNGIDDVVINTHHKATLLTQHLQRHHAINYQISHETELLETGGGLKQALPLLADQFFTLNSDVICIESGDQLVLHRMNQQFDSDLMDGVLLLCPLDKAVGYDGDGDFGLTETGQLQRPQAGQPAYVYMGIQKLHRRFLDESPPDNAFSLSLLYRAALDKGDGCTLYGMVHHGAWLHVGDAQGVALAEDYLAQAE